MKNTDVISVGRTISFRSEISLKLESIEAAILYELLHFWADKGKRGDGFIYKTRTELQEETTLTIKQIRNATKKLVAARWIETKKLMVHNSMTMHYKCLINLNTVLVTTDGSAQRAVAIVQRATHELPFGQFYNRNSIKPVYNNINKQNDLKINKGFEKASTISEQGIKRRLKAMGA